MITKTQFEKVIKECQNFDNLYDKLIDLKIDILESPFYDSFWSLQSELLKLSFSESGIDTINWWMFEKNYGKEESLKMWNKNDVEIPMTTIDDLWNEVKDERI